MVPRYFALLFHFISFYSFWFFFLSLLLSLFFRSLSLSLFMLLVVPFDNLFPQHPFFVVSRSSSLVFRSSLLVITSKTSNTCFDHFYFVLSLFTHLPSVYFYIWTLFSTLLSLIPSYHCFLLFFLWNLLSSLNSFEN